MSTKRGAPSELNHENWNQEESEEESGVFQQATEDELRKRKILRPKRKLTPVIL